MSKKIAASILGIIAIVIMANPQAMIMDSSNLKMVCFYPQFLAWLLFSGYIGLELLLLDEPKKSLRRILKIAMPLMAILIPIGCWYCWYFEGVPLIKHL
jgi:hypothetical protein